MRNHHRLIIFTECLAIAILLFVNCIMYITSDSGFFRTKNISDIVYVYTPQNGIITNQQYNNINFYLSTVGQVAVVSKGLNIDESGLLISNLSLPARMMLSDPQSYGLKILSIKTTGYSPRGIFIIVLMVMLGLGIFAITACAEEIFEWMSET